MSEVVNAVASPNPITRELMGERDLQGAHGCTQSSMLQSPFQADTVAYGTMFTVQTHSDPISILTMEILANPLDSAMDIEVYTKPGDYQGAENDPTQWIQLVNTSITPAREGRGTLIPAENFLGLTMGKDERRAFFISLKSSDLRYRRAVDFQSGQTFHSDGYLSINAGIGLADPGFGDRIYPSRMFSGIIHYTHTTDCSTKMIKSLITYSFYALPKGKGASKADIISEMNQQVKDAIQNIIDTDMRKLRDGHALGIESVESQLSLLDNGNCVVHNWASCVAIDTKITLLHGNTIMGGQINYLFLQQAPEVTKRAQEGSLKVEYAGYHPLQVSIFVAFKGVPSNVALDETQKLFIEEVTTDYLEQQTVGVTNVVVVGTKITNQRGPDFSERRVRSLQQSSEDDWVELSIDVLGMFVPPYTGSVAFVDVVEDAFRYDRPGYIEDLKTGHHRPGSLVEGEKGEYFLGINNANARIPGNSNYSLKSANFNGSTAPESASFGLGKASIVVVAAGVMFAAIGWIWYVVTHEKKTEVVPVVNPSSLGEPLVSDFSSQSENTRKRSNTVKSNLVNARKEQQHHQASTTGREEGNGNNNSRSDKTSRGTHRSSDTRKTAERHGIQTKESRTTTEYNNSSGSKRAKKGLPREENTSLSSSAHSRLSDASYGSAFHDEDTVRTSHPAVSGSASPIASSSRMQRRESNSSNQSDRSAQSSKREASSRSSHRADQPARGSASSSASSSRMQRHDLNSSTHSNGSARSSQREASSRSSHRADQGGSASPSASSRRMQRHDLNSSNHSSGSARSSQREASTRSSRGGSDLNSSNHSDRSARSSQRGASSRSNHRAGQPARGGPDLNSSNHSGRSARSSQRGADPSRSSRSMASSEGVSMYDLR